MIKRGVMFVFLIVMIFAISFVSAANVTSSSDAQVEKAYTCLNNKVAGKCSDLTTEEKIFSLLAISQCKSELLDDSIDEECWPKSNCNAKTTSQAILALDKSNYDIENAKIWLMSETTNPTNLYWYLEIETSNPASCKITYDDVEHSINIDENKKIDIDAGPCLQLTPDDYWLQVADECYGKEFVISCDKSFLTTLLYKKKDNNASTIFVSETVNTAVPDGRTTETVNSWCFKKNGVCDYESSLWAALVLDYKGESVKEYMPYLITLADENQQYMPDAFLYILTGSTDYQINLISKQTSGFWEFSDDKYYDTSIASLALKDRTEATKEREAAMTWLLQTQATDGCWSGNIRDTAFILYSTWPKLTAQAKADCEDKGYFCMSGANCKSIEGNELNEYSCTGASVCCDKKFEKTCSEQNGIICGSDESCIGGNYLDASDTATGQSCCYNGECEKVSSSECENNNGICRSSCFTSENSANYDCQSGVCCVSRPQATTSIFGSWWIWVLGVLILLVIIGIIFRNRLRILLLRFRGKSSGAKPTVGPGPRFPPASPIQQRMIPRRILPPSQPARRPMPRQSDEFSDILKKLKDIGK